MTVNDIVNGIPLYIMVIFGILIVVIFCIASLVKATKRAKELGFSKDDINKVIKSSAIFSIVPSISIDIGLISLSAVVGVPWAWYRLSVIGALMYELAASGMVTASAGYDNMSEFINSSDINLVPVIFMVMSISIIAAATINIFLGKSYQKRVNKYRDKKGPEGSLIMSYFTMAMVLVLGLSQLFKGTVSILVFVTSGIISMLMIILSKKYNISWLTDFVLAFALIISMSLSLVFESILL